jgi:hypothetical protein
MTRREHKYEKSPKKVCKYNYYSILSMIVKEVDMALPGRRPSSLVCFVIQNVQRASKVVTMISECNNEVNATIQRVQELIHWKE